jgi:hypothetical protein
MNPNRYRFKSEEDCEVDDMSKSSKLAGYFYQLAEYQNPKNKKYHVRKVYVNITGSVLDFKEYYLSKSLLDNFVKRIPQGKYLYYAVFNLNEVELPNSSDLVASISNLLK